MCGCHSFSFSFLVLIHEVEFLIECARFPPLPIYDDGKNNNSKLRKDTHLVLRKENHSNKWLKVDTVIVDYQYKNNCVFMVEFSIGDERNEPFFFSDKIDLIPWHTWPC